MSEYPNKSKYSHKKSKQNYHNPETFSEDTLHLNHFFKASRLYIESSEVINTEIHLYLKSLEITGACPYCGSISGQVHSTYLRTLTDLPILGSKVIVRFESRKFFCKNKECSKKTFAEQPGNEICKYRRRTKRCETLVGNLGIKMSAVHTGLSLKAMNIPVSASTVLRTVYRMDIPDLGITTELGVDDWAFRKGLTYGSILVDMKAGIVIDLLADRETASFEHWIREHAGVKLVSRDRSSNYSSAIANTGRSIVEVADRFHLVKNIMDCVTKVISENYTHYRDIVSSQEILPIENQEDTPQKSLKKPIELKQTTDSRTNMFNEVKELQSKGFKINAISRKLHIARQTVRKYIGYQTLPSRRSSPRNGYYKFDNYVEEQYGKGNTLTCIYKEIKNKGFNGSLSPFHYHYQYLSRSRIRETGHTKNSKPVDNRKPLVPIRAISAIVFNSIREYKLDKEDENLMDKLIELKWFEFLYNAAKSFYKTIMGNDGSMLKLWIEEYKDTTISRLKTFITGIILDKRAVENAIVYPISNGIVEGFVNKLKTIKRIMYGRAGIELLKRKMILTNRAFN